uniref:protein CASP-like n=1 Tax=Myxine glutinosa TaxID=7769 RepID=UPI00358E5BCE
MEHPAVASSSARSPRSDSPGVSTQGCPSPSSTSIASLTQPFTSTVSAAAVSWFRFDLPRVQGDLDRVTDGVLRRQDESDVARKRLVELSKDFRKTTEEDVRRAVAPLLKIFQAEVDALSHRSKEAETAFLDVYKQLMVLPDPAPLLENASSRLIKLQNVELEREKLRETLSDYHTEFAQIRNQDVTVKSLREKLRELELELESRAQQLAQERIEKERAEAAQRESYLREEKERALSQLQLGERRARELHLALAACQSEVLEVRNKYEEEASARSAELELLLSDMERVTQRAEGAEREVENLREQTTSAMATTDDARHANEREDELVQREWDIDQREQEIEKTMWDLQRREQDLERRERGLEKREQEVEILQTGQAKRLQELEKHLRMQSDYEEIKAELRLLRSVELAHKSEEEGEGEPLEVLLLERSRRLQDELAALRASAGESAAQFIDLETRYKEVEKVASDQKELIGRLEHDLQMTLPLIGKRTEAEGMADAEKVAEPVVEASTRFLSQSPRPLLEIVTNQRERLRQKNQELETECRKHRQTLQGIQQEVESLRADNVALYGKIQFLQGYSSKERGSDEREQRYRVQYEANLDPFSSFSRQERQRRYTNLTPWDKATLGLGRLVINSKTARSALFLYTLLLHLLIFLVLYRAAWSESIERDCSTFCAQRFADHLHKFHKNEKPGDLW